MSMVVNPTFSRHSISNLSVFFKMSTIFGKQNQFIVKQKIGNMVLNPICSIIWVWACDSFLFGNWNTFRIEDFADID